MRFSKPKIERPRQVFISEIYNKSMKANQRPDFHIKKHSPTCSKSVQINLNVLEMLVMYIFVDSYHWRWGGGWGSYGVGWFVLHPYNYMLCPERSSYCIELLGLLPTATVSHILIFPDKSDYSSIQHSFTEIDITGSDASTSSQL